MPNDGILCDMLWSDPAPRMRTGWLKNDRGVSFLFGYDVLNKFMEYHDLDLICRAHQVVSNGYEFFNDRKLVTIFSAPNYCGQFDNDAAALHIDESLCCKFIEMKQKIVDTPPPAKIRRRPSTPFGLCSGPSSNSP